MNGPTLRFLTPCLLAAASLALGACRLLPKKEAAPAVEAANPDETKDATPGPPAAGEPGTSPDAPKPGEPTEKKQEADAKPAPAPPATDPLEAEEFRGLPKGEAEFILACRSAGSGDKATVTGRDNLIFSTAELRKLGANPPKGSPHQQAAVAGIAAYSARLKAAGIELVLAPVPPKAVVYPDYVAADAKLKDRRHDSHLQSLYADLDKAGVRVVDLTKPLRSDRFNRRGGSFPRAGTVWSPPAAAAAAKAIHKNMKRTEAAKGIVRDKTIVSKEIGVPTDGEVFAADSVGRLDGDRIVAATAGKEGTPILVIGDAHAAAYGQAGQSAGVGDQLALAFGAPAETRAEATMGWKKAAGKFSPTKDTPTKIVAWCFSASDLLAEPAAAVKPAAKPARGASGGHVPPTRAPRGGPSLKLRDDPGLDVRPQ